MKRKLFLRAFIVLLAPLIGSLVIIAPLSAQTTEESTESELERVYAQEELDRLLAPIALYPDVLLSQVLMASTYPLEIVEADRWLKKNQNLTGDQIDAALQDKPWDVSVKSLCHYPSVLEMMSDKLEMTTALGNAFLGQQEQVMNAIQTLRGKAQAQGHLASTDKHKVTVDQDIISIEPARPQVVYIPAYDPCLVYGPWWYSSCSPPWFWYPHIVIGAGFFFGSPVFLSPHHFWSGFFWHRHRIFIHANKTIFFHKPRISKRHGGIEHWQHNPRHRRGVAYHDQKTAGRFGRSIRPGAEARREFRGFSPRGSGSGERERLRTGGTGQERIDGRLQRGIPLPDSRELRRQGRPEADRFRSRGTAGSGSERFRQQRRGNAFEEFRTSGPEVRQNSQRGRESLDGRFRQGGGQRFDRRMQGGSGSGSRGSGSINRSSGGRSGGGRSGVSGGGSRRGDRRGSR